jgi:hypothetical protein
MNVSYFQPYDVFSHKCTMGGDEKPVEARPILLGVGMGAQSERAHDKLELATRLRIASPFYDAELNTLVPHGDWCMTLNPCASGPRGRPIMGQTDAVEAARSYAAFFEET